MEWDNTTIVSSMGMDWEDPTADIAMSILDLPALEFTADGETDAFGLSMFEPPVSPISQIISHDCMWSGTCEDISHPGKPHFNNKNSCCKGSSSSSNTTSSNSTTTNNNNNVKNINNSQQQNNNNNTTNNSSSNNNNNNNIQIVKSGSVKLNEIPAGRSLLLSSRINHQKTHHHQNHRITNDKGGTQTRPDTPLSLDDETPEFKHQIDLIGTITRGGNGHHNQHQQIKREREDSLSIINLIKDHLEEDIDIEHCSVGGAGKNGGSSGNILDIISSKFDHTNENVLDYLKLLSDYEEDENDDDSAVESDSEYASSSYERSSQNSNASSSSGGKIGNSNNHNNNHNNNNSYLPTIKVEYQETSFGDHSYTLPKNRFDTRDLGVQTPSDSGKSTQFSLISLNLLL